MALSPTHPDAVRQLERLADRLRVVGPRLAARDSREADDVLRLIRAGLQQLADLAADEDGEPRRPIPELAGYALADQALVLGNDLLGVGPGAELQEGRTDLFRVVAVAAISRIQRLI